MSFIGTRRFPKGPSLKYPEAHQFNASGTQIRFMALRHNDSSIRSIADYNGVINLYEEALFMRFDEDAIAEPGSLGLLLKYWEFTGIPVLDGTGELGDMRLAVSIESMAEFSSLFRPKRLECAIERFIYTSSDAYRLSGECRMNWRVVTINENVWVNYQSTGYAGFRNAEECYESVWHTPISDQHLLTVRFDQVIRKKRTRLAEVYQTIIDKVMNSFEVQLSSDAQAQQRAAKENYPDETLSESLPPYEFEEIELLERLELINLVSEENNHDFSIPDDVFEAQVQQKNHNQQQLAKKIKERTLASHLRFKQTEQNHNFRQ